MKTVVGAWLNYRGAWAAMESTMRAPPHHKPPAYPVLYLKPANTWLAPGHAIVLPSDVDEVEVGAALGVVIGRPAARVRAEDALSHVAGYRIVNDVTVPHEKVLRPPLKQKCRDGFCPLGPVVPAAQVASPDALAIRAYVNGALRQTSDTSQLIRDVARLIADVTEFMTLGEGDVLLVGVPENPPRARAGDRVAIEIDELGRLENPLQAEEDAR